MEAAIHHRTARLLKIIHIPTASHMENTHRPRIRESAVGGTSHMEDIYFMSCRQESAVGGTSHVENICLAGRKVQWVEWFIVQIP